MDLMQAVTIKTENSISALPILSNLGLLMTHQLLATTNISAYSVESTSHIMVNTSHGSPAPFSVSDIQVICW